MRTEGHSVVRSGVGGTLQEKFRFRVTDEHGNATKTPKRLIPEITVSPAEQVSFSNCIRDGL
jgi:hypothetical protein